MKALRFQGILPFPLANLQEAKKHLLRLVYVYLLDIYTESAFRSTPYQANRKAFL